MKTTSPAMKFLVYGLSAMLLLFFSTTAISQEPAKKESQKKVIVKIISDDNGTTTVIDTTLEMPESAMLDSIRQEVDKVIELGSGGRHARIRMRGMPEGFGYNFDFPCPPECPMNPRDLDLDFNWQGSLPDAGNNGDYFHEWGPGPERRIMRFRDEGKGQTLNDMLGDIPMDRVKNYSIKDTKHGKKIVIELEDGPIVDRREQVIIIREPGRPNRYGRQGQKQKQIKVYRTPDTSETMDVPPPPPPPPPQGKK